ncbi:MAG TPA: beta-ketoacyl-ACP reductase, partial [Acidimicrobiaceae bacterium]|nr:beta-ketoacyl-ACP reductase [Acidimicrobiaceae bacterium]
TYRGEIPPEANESDLLAVRCDVTDTEQVDAAFTSVEDELGPIEVLVANAGITRDGLVLR